MLTGFKPRIGPSRLLFGVNSREDDRCGSLLVGATTYSKVEGKDDEEYKVSYVELGGRSDHVAHALAKATGTEIEPQLVSQASDDVEYTGTPEMNKEFREQADKPKSDKSDEAAA